MRKHEGPIRRLVWGGLSALIDQIEATDIGEVIDHNRYDEITKSGVYRIHYINGPTGNRRSNNEILIVATVAGASSGIKQTLYRSFGVQTRNRSAASWSKWRDVVEVLQDTGSATDAVMSQKAVTMALNNLKIKSGVAEEIDAKIDDGVYVLYPRNPNSPSPVSSKVVLVSNAYIRGASITTKQYSEGMMREKSGSASWEDWFSPLRPIGRRAKRIGAPLGVAIGDDSSVLNDGVSVGYHANSEDECVSIGASAYSELESTALGANADAVTLSIAIGARSEAKEGAVAIGVDSSSIGSGVAIGPNAIADRKGVAVGGDSNQECTAGDHGVALGAGALARDEGVSIGANSLAYSSDCIAIGSYASVSEEQSIQIGRGHNAVSGSYQEFDRYLRMTLREGSEVRFPAIPPYCLHIKGILEGDKVVDTILNHSSVRTLHQSPNQTAEELDFEWSQGFEMITFPAQIQNIIIEKF